MPRLVLIAFLVVVLANSACRKSRTPAAPEPAAPPPAKVLKEPTLAELNAALEGFVTARGQLPATLEDLVKIGFVAKVPTPPPGQQFVIDRQNYRVVLVNR